MNITVDELIQLNDYMEERLQTRVGYIEKNIRTSSQKEGYEAGYKNGLKRKIEDEVEGDEPF